MTAITDYLETLSQFSTGGSPFTDRYYRTAGRGTTATGQQTFYIKDEEDRQRVNVNTFTLPDSGFENFDAISIPMIQAAVWSQGNRPYPVNAYELPANPNAQYLITGQLSGCAFFVAETNNIIYAGHVQPSGAIAGYGASLLANQLRSGNGFAITGIRTDSTTVAIAPADIQVVLATAKSAPPTRRAGDKKYATYATAIGYYAPQTPGGADVWNVIYQEYADVQDNPVQITGRDQLYP